MASLPDQVIGAFLVLLGVLVTQLIAMAKTRLEQKNKLDILLREKYEELGLNFLESMKLPHNLMICKNQETLLSLTLQESGNRAHLLALLYFPKLREATGQYIASYSLLLLAVASLYQEKDIRPIGMQVFDKPEYINANKKYIAARDNLQDQIQQYAPIYAKS